MTTTKPLDLAEISRRAQTIRECADPGRVAELASQLVEDVDDLLAEVEGLWAENAGRQWQIRNLNAEADRYADQIASLKRELASKEDEARRAWGHAHEARERASAAERRLRDVRLLRMWRNEDGKDFVFAEDLWKATNPEVNR